MLVLPLLILWPLAEAFVAYEVAQAIGVVLTLVLLALAWPVGVWLTKAEGRSAWRRLTEAVSQGRRPGGEVVDGALVLLGGMLLIVPGFITDVIGLLLLTPPARALARRSGARHLLGSRLVHRMSGGGPWPRGGSPGGSARSGRRSGGSGGGSAGSGESARGRAYDVDSTAVDIDHPQLRHP